MIEPSAPRAAPPFGIYWGDLHNHCAISYGHGSLERALAVARQQLDFCAVTGHAFWPDMPSDRERFGYTIDYHNAGFAKLRANWERILDTVGAAHEDGRFVTFPSYEWHSGQDGDHHIVYGGARGPLVGGARIADVRAALHAAAEAGTAPPAVAIPHHFGYPPGARGGNWNSFVEDLTPFVEIYSLHGCAESDHAEFPMLHTMGPRTGAHTAAAGLRRGHRFGLVASTDHHSGYPGSHGYGRLAAYASALTREALWGAFHARRVYAVTGDKIAATLHVDGAWPGQTIAGSGRPRHITARVGARDFVDYVELLKNERLLRRWTGPDPATAPDVHAGNGSRTARPTRALVRLEWGWGRPTETTAWDARATLEDGRLHGVETCFAGPAIVAPQADRSEDEDQTVPHRLAEQTDKGCAWTSVTTGNPTVRHSATQALILDLEMDPRAALLLDVNGRRFRITLAELLVESRAWCLRTPPLLSESIVAHQAVPHAHSQMDVTLDDSPGDGTGIVIQPGGAAADVYRLRVRQRNGQWAWLSPIWVMR
jgi:hypothetical protein